MNKIKERKEFVASYVSDNTGMTDIQKIILNIFKEVKKVCDNNSIKYFAIGGTCLGAVRHKGFIPWDDDLDIAIPIEDYIRFIDAARRELPDYLTVYTPADARHNSLFFIKVMDKRTTLTESAYVRWPDSYEGVWVDIMPLGGLPKGKFQTKIFLKYNGIIKRLSFKVKSAEQTESRLFGKLLYKCGPWANPSFFWDMFLKSLNKHPLSRSETTGYLWSESSRKLFFPSEWFGEGTLTEFEDTNMTCPIEYNNFLTKMFGNFMEYPPEDKRNSGHEFANGIIDLSHSYIDYQSGKLKVRR